VDEVLAAGAARVVVGTAALREPSFARQLVDLHGATHVAAAIDVRDGMAVGEGWRSGARGVLPETAIATLSAAGVRTFEVTAVSRDGLLGGPDLELLGRLVEIGAGEIIASGGITSVADLVAAREVGCQGAIVGRALYEGRFSLAEALAAVSA